MRSPRSRPRAAAVLLTLAVLVAGLGMVRSQPAAAADLPEGKYAVTMAARVCNSYSQITANKSRNNIQESLNDLGADTAYTGGNASAPVSPDIEEPNQPDCTPLDGWKFQLGPDYTGKSAATKYLSTVTSPYDTSIQTSSSVPLLSPTGTDTGQTIRGATTVTLTAAQLAQAQRNDLWVQGGTRDDPLPDSPANGFGALRCAQDGVNGDNVEFISFPAKTRHVFCYYYLVRPGANASTITVKKQVSSDVDGGGRFKFDGNLSYGDTDGDGTNDFVLSADQSSSGSQSFVRAAGESWAFDEQPPTGAWGEPGGWEQPDPPVCTGTDPSNVVQRPGGATVTPEAGEHVVCTVTNTRRLPQPGVLLKQAYDGTGQFQFHLQTPGGDRTPAPVTAGPDGALEVVAQVDEPYPTGTYRIYEDLPDVAGARWDLERVVCNGVEQTVRHRTVDGQDQAGVEFDLGPGEEVSDPRCLFTNRLVPTGEITISKESVGGTGTFDYRIAHDIGSRGVRESYEYAADTSVANPADATPVTGTAAADDLQVGEYYRVQEIIPPTGDPGTYWQLDSASCEGAIRQRDDANASVLVQITAADPDVHCSFTNRLVHRGELSVVKQTSDDPSLRPDPALIDVACDDRDAEQLEVPAGESTAPALELTATEDGTTCEIDESSTGAADDVDVTTTAELTTTTPGPDGPVTTTRPVTLPASVTLSDESSYSLAIDNELTRTPGPSPTPSPTSSPTASPTQSPTGSPTPTEPPGPPGPTDHPSQSVTAVPTSPSTYAPVPPGPDDDAGAGSAGSGLPDTGAPAMTVPLIALGLVLLLAGGVLAAAGLRRRH